jgi:Spy/CpxP family protein refolding chaperone
MRPLALAALIVIARLSGSAQDATILPYPLPNQYEDLKKHLSLTDAQINSLSTIAKTRNDAQSNIYRQINEKYTALNTLLANNSTDSVRIGQLMIEINNLRKQTVPVEPYRSQALNILLPDQKLKLPVLVQALQLQGAAWEATNLNLIDSPAPRVLPADIGGGAAIGVIGLSGVPGFLGGPENRPE